MLPIKEKYGAKRAWAQYLYKNSCMAYLYRDTLGSRKKPGSKSLDTGGNKLVDILLAVMASVTHWQIVTSDVISDKLASCYQWYYQWHVVFFLPVMYFSLLLMAYTPQNSFRAGKHIVWTSLVCGIMICFPAFIVLGDIWLLILKMTIIIHRLSLWF